MPWSDAENAEYFGQPQEDYRERDVLLDRLREADADYTVAWGSGDLYGEAADEIVRLRAALTAMRDHWREFGPEHGFDETLETACRVLDA